MSRTKIDKLTRLQEQQLVEFRDKWLRIGLCTAPINKRATQKIITNFYRRIGKPPPRFWWSSSPLSAQWGIAVIRLLSNSNLGANLGANLRDNLRANLRDNLWENLRANLRANLRDNLWENLGANLWDNFRDNLADNLITNLGANLRANLRANLGENLRENLTYEYTYLIGSLDSYWISYYLYPHIRLRKMHHSDDLKLLYMWAGLAKSSFWWWPFENYVFVSDRPCVINKDARGRLHCDNGASVAFRDGFSVFHYHGVEMPQELILDHSKISVERIEKEQNAEARRALMEIYGPAKYLQDSGAERVSADSCGSLLRKRIPGDEDIMFVLVKNSTPEPNGENKMYWLRVPPNMRTASEAVAWTFGFDKPTDYRPDEQT